MILSLFEKFARRFVAPAYQSFVSCFQFNGNEISDWNDLKQLENAKGIQTVYLEGNPLQRDPNYRRKIKLALPSLTQIDSTLCR